MMPAYLNSNPAGVPHVGYPNDPILDDLARQIAASQRRFSRGSNGQRPGGAMRIVKPSSANNSPRSAIMQARRRTFMNDALLARRNHPLVDNTYQQPSPADLSGEMFMESAVRAARPVSWHPSSHLAQTQVLPLPANQYPFPPYQDMELLTNYQQFPPTPAAYSGYTSPSSTFSPLSLPYSGFDASSYFSPANWAGSAGTGMHGLPSPTNCQLLPEQVTPIPPQQQQEQPALDAGSAWDSFVTHGFSTTTPPTPDGFPTALQAETKVPAEDSVACQPLEDEEEEGEILIGMGLYDPPEKEVTDPTLESYHRSVAHILGEAYKYPEPTGRGLKLEETWEPPESDDEDEEEKDADADEDEDDS